ncbi:MAG: ABC transporter permease subunit [Anaerolineales bacterium]|nr:MAG: ABC transporter permease subunit [Anaerolineales bacterium]
MKKIKVIILKEWAEVFKNRLVLSTVIFMPLLFTALPLIMIFTTRDSGMEELSSDMPAQFSQLCSSSLTGGECFQVYMVSQFMILFMLTPLIVPVNIAAYSIVGEKTTRSLEPLLATPITTIELLAGKNLAAAIPAVLATWISFFLFIAGAWILVRSPGVIAELLDLMWWIAVLVAGPLLSILSVNFSIMVSSRVNDPRVAEQVSVIVILPVLGLFFGQIAGLFFLNRLIIIAFTLLLFLLDILMVYIAVRLFQRETILTRWK